MNLDWFGVPPSAVPMQLKNGIWIQRRGAENAEWRGGEVAEVPPMVSSDWPARLCVSPRSQRLCVKVSQTSTAWIGLKAGLQTSGVTSERFRVPMRADYSIPLFWWHCIST